MKEEREELNLSQDSHMQRVSRLLQHVQLPSRVIDQLRGLLPSSVLDAGIQEPLLSGSDAAFPIWEPRCIEDLLTSGLTAFDKEERSATKRLLQQMFTRGRYRKLGTVPPGWQQSLHEMEGGFPNFREVISYLRSACALASVTNGVLRFTPLLLVGPPGVGKSLFAQRLAEFVGTGLTCLRMENAQANAALAGTDRHWASAKPGAIHEMLVYGDYANPVVYLDEIDKTIPDRYDPCAPLYSLLEPDTARTFSDLCFPALKLDARRILWIATCNSLAPIPEPLLSRFRVIPVGALDPDGAVTVTRNIICGLRQEFGDQVGNVHFSEAAIRMLSKHSPRRIRQLALEAVGRALHDGADLISDQDLPAPKSERRPIGF